MTSHDVTAPSPTTPERLQRIMDKLAAAERRRQLPAVFGADGHRFRLGPPVTEHEVAGFEARHGIALPIEYRAFLTEIGNGGPSEWGGAGPFWGLLPLERWDDVLSEGTRADVLATAFPVPPGHEYGPDWLSEVGLADDGEEWFPGAIALAHIGSGDLAVLVVTGPGRGRVAYVSWDAYVRAPAYTGDADFLAWYERWLDAALEGERYWY
jgi:hypothetical protein